MYKRTTLTIFLLTVLCLHGWSQNDVNRPKMLELGLHGGHYSAAGNIDFTPGFGMGVHLRKSLDYVFSLRGELLFGKLFGEDQGNIRSFETNWYSGSLDLMVSLNNMKWKPKIKKVDLFALVGLGYSSFTGDVTDNGNTMDIEQNNGFFGNIGAGVSFKINDKINIGLEHKLIVPFGKNADKIDGIQTLTLNDNRKTFADVLNYSSIRININLGKYVDKNQPLNWLMPIDAIVNDVDNLKNTRVTLADDDNDGIINQLDEQEDTPENAPVNSKGIALDSDGDEIPDYADEEPYSPPNKVVNEQGVSEKEDVLGKASQLIDEKLKKFQMPIAANDKTDNIGIQNWFLPSIFFPSNGVNVSNNHIGDLHNVAKAIKGNTQLKFVVTGYADMDGNPAYNKEISYQRAKSVIEVLKSQGVDPQQLILQYKGEESQFGQGRKALSRRVDIDLAKNEKEMMPPK